MDPNQTALLIQTMVAGLPDADFPTELVFAPSDGVVTEVETKEWTPSGKGGLGVVIQGSGDAVEMGPLVVANVEVGAKVTRGQWIGMRRCE